MKKTYEDEFVTVYEDDLQVQKVYKCGGTITSMKPDFYREYIVNDPIKGETNLPWIQSP